MRSSILILWALLIFVVGMALMGLADHVSGGDHEVVTWVLLVMLPSMVGGVIVLLMISQMLFRRRADALRLHLPPETVVVRRGLVWNRIDYFGSMKTPQPALLCRRAEGYGLLLEDQPNILPVSGAGESLTPSVGRSFSKFLVLHLPDRHVFFTTVEGWTVFGANRCNMRLLEEMKAALPSISS